MTDTEEKAKADQTELLSFRVGTQEYAVDIMTVREIRGWTNATPLPHAPPFVRGVINLRGTVLTIVAAASAGNADGGAEDIRQRPHDRSGAHGAHP